MSLRENGGEVQVSGLRFCVLTDTLSPDLEKRRIAGSGYMYWRISSFPELDHLADDERQALIREHAGWKLTIKLIIRSLLGGFITTALGCSIVIERYPWQLAFLLGPLFFILGVLLAYQYSIIRIRGQLIIFLEEIRHRHRLPMCLHCGYNLEGSTGLRCPECGHSFPKRIEG